jgi:hypothetical protein
MVGVDKNNKSTKHFKQPSYRYLHPEFLSRSRSMTQSSCWLALKKPSSGYIATLFPPLDNMNRAEAKENLNGSQFLGGDVTELLNASLTMNM